jgi:hypothetical protein
MDGGVQLGLAAQLRIIQRATSENTNRRILSGVWIMAYLRHGDIMTAESVKLELILAVNDGDSPISR